MSLSSFEEQPASIFRFSIKYILLTITKNLNIKIKDFFKFWQKIPCCKNNSETGPKMSVTLGSELKMNKKFKPAQKIFQRVVNKNILFFFLLPNNILQWSKNKKYEGHVFIDLAWNTPYIFIQYLQSRSITAFLAARASAEYTPEFSTKTRMSFLLSLSLSFPIDKFMYVDTKARVSQIFVLYIYIYIYIYI